MEYKFQLISGLGYKLNFYNTEHYDIGIGLKAYVGNSDKKLRRLVLNEQC